MKNSKTLKEKLKLWWFVTRAIFTDNFDLNTTYHEVKYEVKNDHICSIDELAELRAKMME